MSMEEVWLEIAKQMEEQPEHIAGVSASYSFDLTGDDGAEYGLNFKEGAAEIIAGGLEDAECALTMNVKNFKKLLQGELNATTAFMTGRIKVKGNIGLALKLEAILKKYSF